MRRVLFPVVFLVVGFLLLLGAVWNATSTMLFVRRAAQATGTITDQVAVEGTDNEGHRTLTYRPTFTFQTPDNHWHVVTSKVSTSSSHTSGSRTVETTPRVHDRVTVLYDPANPNEAKLDTFANLWLAATILGGLGGVFTLLGAIFLTTGLNQVPWMRAGWKRP